MRNDPKPQIRNPRPENQKSANHPSRIPEFLIRFDCGIAAGSPRDESARVADMAAATGKCGMRNDRNAETGNQKIKAWESEVRFLSLKVEH